MTRIIKGENLPVPGQVWRIAVVRRAPGAGVPAVDASALLLDATGRVRNDGDLVFYNQLAHPSGAVRLVGQARDGEERIVDWLEIDTARVEPAVQRIVITASSDEGMFGQVPDLCVRTLGAATGEQLALYEVDDATTETAFVLGEFYRRDGAWKFRAVGQGYDSGLVGLAEDFGIEGRDPGGPAPAVEGGTPGGPVPLHAVKDEAPGGPAPVSIPAHVPPPVPVGSGPSAWSPAGVFGEDFPEVVRSGNGRTRITFDDPLPAGHLLVDSQVRGDGYFSVHSLDEKGKDDVLLANTLLEDFRGRALLRHDGRGPLRLRVNADRGRRWTIALRPVHVADELGRGAEGRGSDVLLHTGPAAELAARLRSADGQTYFLVKGYEPDGGEYLLANEVGRRPKDARPLPEGPLLVVVKSADGDWSLEVRPLREDGSRSARFWRRASR